MTHLLDRENTIAEVQRELRELSQSIQDVAARRRSDLQLLETMVAETRRLRAQLNSATNQRNSLERR